MMERRKQVERGSEKDEKDAESEEKQGHGRDLSADALPAVGRMRGDQRREDREV